MAFIGLSSVCAADVNSSSSDLSIMQDTQPIVQSVDQPVIPSSERPDLGACDDVVNANKQPDLWASKNKKPDLWLTHISCAENTPAGPLGHVAVFGGSMGGGPQEHYYATLGGAMGGGPQEHYYATLGGGLGGGPQEHYYATLCGALGGGSPQNQF